MTALEQTECPECKQIIHFQPQRWKAQVVCSNCQASFAVEASAPPQTPAEKGVPIPAHLQGKPEPSAAQPTSAATGSDPPTTFRYQRSKVMGNLVSTVLVLVLVGIAIGGILTLAMMDLGGNNSGGSESDKDGSADENIHYILAGKKRGKVAKVEVSVKLVEYGPITVKDGRSRVHESNDSMIQIHVRLRSRRDEPVYYTSWYGNAFDRGGSSKIATLTDQEGDVCEMPVFEDVTGVRGHTAKATLERNQFVQDCLIFELPPGKKITDIEELRLSLPMDSINATSDMHFKIPQDMIKLIGRQN